MIRGSLAYPPVLDDVIAVAAVAFDVPADELTGSSRVKPMMDYRHMTIAACRRQGVSFPRIAAAFGGLDHKTVMSACRRVAADPELARRSRLISDAAESAPGVSKSTPNPHAHGVDTPTRYADNGTTEQEVA